MIEEMFKPTKILNDNNQLYLYILTLNEMLKYRDTAIFAQDYLWETFKSKRFDEPNNHSTELYLLLNSFTNENKEFNTIPLIEWAKNSIKGDSSDNNELLLQLESKLKVSEDCKTLRRNPTIQSLYEKNKQFDCEITPILESLSDVIEKGANIISNIGQATSKIVKKTIKAGAILALAPILGTLAGIALQNKKIKKLGENTTIRKSKYIDEGVLSSLGSGAVKVAGALGKGVAKAVKSKAMKDATKVLTGNIKSPIKECSTSTSSGSIASVAAPVIIKRRTKKKVK